MAIKTELQTKYVLQRVLLIVICLGMGLWGVYDYIYKIPRQQRIFERGQVCLKVKEALEAEPGSKAAQERIQEAADALNEEMKRLKDAGVRPPEGRIDAIAAIDGITERDEANWSSLLPLFAETLQEAAQRRSPEDESSVKIVAAVPLVRRGVDKTADVSPPGKFDRATQWMFILCLPFVPVFTWKFVQARRRTYRLEDDGTFHAPEGTWTGDEIADIDMRRWMAKSIAHVVHRDGRRIKLDDYIYRNAHLIVGAIASEKYPDEWTAEARAAAAGGDDAGDASGTGGEGGADAGAAPEEAAEKETPAEV